MFTNNNRERRQEMTLSLKQNTKSINHLTVLDSKDYIISVNWLQEDHLMLLT